MTDWPEPLKNAVRTILATRHPAMIGWGPDLVIIPDDAYVALLKAERHSHILGRPLSRTFADFWPALEARLEPVLAGQGASWTESESVCVTHPDGTRGKHYWTYSYAAQGQEAAIAALSESEDRFAL